CQTTRYDEARNVAHRAASRPHQPCETPLMAHFPLFFDAPVTLILAAGAGAAALGLAAGRRIALPTASAALAAAGTICLILAAGALTWNAASPPNVVVMVDLSASTRTATYHDPAALERRLGQLLAATPYATYAFAAQSVPADLAHLQMEMDGNQTVFDP